MVDAILWARGAQRGERKGKEITEEKEQGFEKEERKGARPASEAHRR
jgi:hypothetical protein